MKDRSQYHPTISLNLPEKKHWYLIPLISLGLTFIYQSIIHFNPYNLSWLSDGSFSLGNLLYFIFIDQALIETITVTVILVGIKVYVRYSGLEKVQRSPIYILRYLLKFLPLFVLIYFIFAPLTTGLRFAIHNFPELNAAEYWEDYFFLNQDIYLSYLFPTFLAGYGFLIVGIMMGKVEEEPVGSEASLKPILLKNENGETYLSPLEIALITRENRKYLVKTDSLKSYQTSYNLAQLEDLLPYDHFIRINRSTIIRKDQIDSFAYWENQKYIIKTVANEEFVVSRERMKEIKQYLEKN